jgi:hypothetical protein
MAEAVSRRPLTAESRNRNRTKWHWDMFYLSSSVFPCQYQSATASYSFIYNLGNRPVTGRSSET